MSALSAPGAGGVPLELLVALTGALAGLGALLLLLGLLGRPPGAVSAAPGSRWRGAGPAVLGRRVLPAVAAGLVVLLATRWVVAALGVGLLVAGWGRLVGGSAEEGRGIARLEALATWTESLRDTIAGAVGLEQSSPSMRHFLGEASSPLRPHLEGPGRRWPWRCATGEGLP